MAEQIAQSPAHSSTEPSRHSFGGILRALAVGASSVALAVGASSIAGCSPQEKSYWTGSFTKLPDPPPNARMQIGVSTEDDGTVFINYVVWDSGTNNFIRKDIHYTTTTLHPGSFSEAGGYEQKIIDGEVLASGAIVNQSKGVILLPGGLTLDGRTGNVLSTDGKIVKEFGK